MRETRVARLKISSDTINCNGRVYGFTVITFTQKNSMLWGQSLRECLFVVLPALSISWHGQLQLVYRVDGVDVAQKTLRN